MTKTEDKAVYDLYAQIGLYLTKFNMLEMNLRIAFNRSAGTKLGPLLGHVQSISTRLDMVMTALNSVADEQPWASKIAAMEQDIRTAISFRNELSHGLLSQEGGSATLVLKAFDTNRKPRTTSLSLEDLQKKNAELDDMLSSLLLGTTAGILPIGLSH